MAAVRTEDQIFFIYDHTALKREQDDLKDAVIYFFPSSMSVDDQCAICGQLMGMVEFFTSFIASPPAIFILQKNKMAIKHLGKYTLALGGNREEPDEVVTGQLDYLHRLFTLYQGSMRHVEQTAEASGKAFADVMQDIWDCYLPFIRRYGDSVAAAFESLPSVDLPDAGSASFLRASHILQQSQRTPGVHTGCLLYKNRVLYSQFHPNVTARMLILRPKQAHFPGLPVKLEFEAPSGVRILRVFLTPEEWTELGEADRVTGFSAPMVNNARWSRKPFERHVSETRRKQTIYDVTTSGRKPRGGSALSPSKSPSKRRAIIGEDGGSTRSQSVQFKEQAQGETRPLGNQGSGSRQQRIGSEPGFTSAKTKPKSPRRKKRSTDKDSEETNAGCDTLKENIGVKVTLARQTSLEMTASNIVCFGRVSPGNDVPLVSQGKDAPLTSQWNPLTSQGNGAPLVSQGNGAPLVSQGNDAPLASQGNGAPLVSQGNGAPLVSQGNDAPLASQGNGAPLVSQGNGAPLVSQGNDAPLASQGNGAPLVSQGNGAPLVSQGNDAPLASQGNGAPLVSQGNGAPLLSQKNDPPLVSLDKHAPLVSQGNDAPLTSQGNPEPVMSQGNDAHMESVGAAAQRADSEDRGAMCDRRQQSHPADTTGTSGIRERVDVNGEDSDGDVFEDVVDNDPVDAREDILSPDITSLAIRESTPLNSPDASIPESRDNPTDVFPSPNENEPRDRSGVTSPQSDRDAGPFALFDDDPLFSPSPLDSAVGGVSPSRTTPQATFLLPMDSAAMGVKSLFRNVKRIAAQNKDILEDLARQMDAATSGPDDSEDDAQGGGPTRAGGPRAGGPQGAGSHGAVVSRGVDNALSLTVDHGKSSLPSADGEDRVTGLNDPGGVPSPTPATWSSTELHPGPGASVDVNSPQVVDKSGGANCDPINLVHTRTPGGAECSVTGVTDSQTATERCSSTDDVVSDALDGCVHDGSPLTGHAETPSLDPADTRSSDPADTRSPDPADTRSLDPADTRSLDPADTRSSDPADTRSLDPADTRSLDPADTRSPDPADTHSPDPADTRSPDPEDRRSPDPAAQERDRVTADCVDHARPASQEASPSRTSHIARDLDLDAASAPPDPGEVGEVALNKMGECDRTHFTFEDISIEEYHRISAASALASADEDPDVHPSARERSPGYPGRRPGSLLPISVDPDSKEPETLDGGFNEERTESPWENLTMNPDDPDLLDSPGDRETLLELSLEPDVRDLQQLELYIQGNSDTVLLLLMEEGTLSRREKLNALWAQMLPQLAELEVYLRQHADLDNRTQDSGSDYNYLTYNSFTQTLSGKISMVKGMLQPMSHQELDFCGTSVMMHHDFRKEPSLSDMTLRNYTTCVFGHRAQSEEVFLQPRTARPPVGVPSTRDTTMCLDAKECQRLLRQQGVPFHP